MIPLASNVLNKELRGIKGQGGKKTPSQSFGSNHPSNFVLACRRCNALKKNRMPMKETLERVKQIRFNKVFNSFYTKTNFELPVYSATGDSGCL